MCVKSSFACPIHQVRIHSSEIRVNFRHQYIAWTRYRIWVQSRNCESVATELASGSGTPVVAHEAHFRTHTCYSILQSRFWPLVASTWYLWSIYWRLCCRGTSRSVIRGCIVFRVDRYTSNAKNAHFKFWSCHVLPHKVCSGTCFVQLTNEGCFYFRAVPRSVVSQQNVIKPQNVALLFTPEKQKTYCARAITSPTAKKRSRPSGPPTKPPLCENRSQSLYVHTLEGIESFRPSSRRWWSPKRTRSPARPTSPYSWIARAAARWWWEVPKAGWTSKKLRKKRPI